MFQDQNAGKMFADEAAVLFERSITTAMKGNILLYFSYADFEEVCTVYKEILIIIPPAFMPTAI